MTSILSDTYTITVANNLMYHDMDEYQSETNFVRTFPTRRDFIRRVLDMVEEIGEKLNDSNRQRLDAVRRRDSRVNADNFNRYVQANVSIMIEGNTATIDLDDFFDADGGGPYTPDVYYVDDDGEAWSVDEARESLLGYTLNIENNLEYHVLDIQSNEDYQLGEVSDRRYFITRVLDIASNIYYDLNLDKSKDKDKIGAALRAEGYDGNFYSNDHTRATMYVRIEGNTATIDIEDEFLRQPWDYSPSAYFLTESGEQLDLGEARERLLGNPSGIPDFEVSITIEGMDPSELPDEVTIRRKTLTRNGNTYTFRTSGLPAEIFSFILDDLIKELGFSDTTRTVDMNNRSAVITVEQDFTFPLPSYHIVELLKDGFLYTYGNDTLKMYDVNLRAEVLSLQMPKVKSVVAQGEHFAVSYAGGFKVYRKFFVDNEYEVDLKYEVNVMGDTYLALRGNTMVAYDDKDEKVRIYRFGTVKEFSIDNGDDSAIIIGDTHIYSYDSYDTIKIYNFKGERVKTFEFDAEIMRVQYYADEKLYITDDNKGMTQTIILDLDDGDRTTIPNLKTYIYDNRIYNIYEDKVELDGQLIYEIPPNKDIYKFYASGGYICMVDSRFNASIIQNTSIIKNGTQWVDGDITYTVTAVSGDFVTMSDGSEVSLVVNKVDLLKDFKAKVEEGFDWEGLYNVDELQNEKMEVKKEIEKSIITRELATKAKKEAFARHKEAVIKEKMISKKLKDLKEWQGKIKNLSLEEYHELLNKTYLTKMKKCKNKMDLVNLREWLASDYKTTAFFRFTRKDGVEETYCLTDSPPDYELDPDDKPTSKDKMIFDMLYADWVYEDGRPYILDSMSGRGGRPGNERYVKIILGGAGNRLVRFDDLLKRVIKVKKGDGSVFYTEDDIEEARQWGDTLDMSRNSEIGFILPRGWSFPVAVYLKYDKRIAIGNIANSRARSATHGQVVEDVYRVTKIANFNHRDGIDTVNECKGKCFKF